MLEVRQLSVSYGAVAAVRGVDIDVSGDEAVALLGPNGAGKTSTLRGICRLQSCGGTVRFDGQLIGKMTPDAVARAGLILVPEGRRLFPTLSVQENLLMGTSARNGRKSEFDLDHVYDLFPALVPLRNTSARTLSGGEQQMVAVGRGLVAAPRFLLLDEPSLGLSPKASLAVFSVLKQVSVSVGMLIVEQNTERALDLCARGYVLSAGQLVMSGSQDELRDRESLMAAYLQGEVLGGHDSKTSYS